MTGVHKPETYARMQEVWIERFTNYHGPSAFGYDKVKYTGATNKIEIFCNTHKRTFYQAPNNHVRSNGCPECRAQKCRDKLYGKGNPPEEFLRKAREQWGNTYEYDMSTYICGKRKITCICKKHGEFSQRADAHTRGAGCPRCRASRGELHIAEALKKLGIRYKSQYSIKSPRKCGRMLFDFMLLDINIIIEYDGRQHFESIPFYGGDDGFRERQSRDVYKNKWAKENGYMLLRIPYTIPSDSIERALLVIKETIIRRQIKCQRMK